MICQLREPARAAAHPLRGARPCEAALPLGFLPAQMQQEPRDIDPDRTDISTRATKSGRERQMTGRAAEQVRTDDRSDRTRIGRIVGVAADAPVNRTDVEARAAADAIKGLAHD